MVPNQGTQWLLKLLRWVCINKNSLQDLIPKWNGFKVNADVLSGSLTGIFFREYFFVLDLTVVAFFHVSC